MGIQNETESGDNGRLPGGVLAKSILICGEPKPKRHGKQCLNLPRKKT